MIEHDNSFVVVNLLSTFEIRPRSTDNGKNKEKRKIVIYFINIPEQAK